MLLSQANVPVLVKLSMDLAVHCQLNAPPLTTNAGAPPALGGAPVVVVRGDAPAVVRCDAPAVVVRCDAPAVVRCQMGCSCC